ncbi:hypothetical protein CC80DRAFT_508821 [Byssothecium circinans]|uniref:Uncharacterized protein n=1 Tax=Byssothecium circinans TaxID=147558 RepID=A0A6A5TJ16_9PLEO|nr:hypothetical protein CC80DRAFT_508821 [Byssothecium circinans]
MPSSFPVAPIEQTKNNHNEHGHGDAHAKGDRHSLVLSKCESLFKLLRAEYDIPFQVAQKFSPYCVAKPQVVRKFHKCAMLDIGRATPAAIERAHDEYDSRYGDTDDDGGDMVLGVRELVYSRNQRGSDNYHVESWIVGDCSFLYTVVFRVERQQLTAKRPIMKILPWRTEA